jgi:hypothetical protein
MITTTIEALRRYGNIEQPSFSGRIITVQVYPIKLVLSRKRCNIYCPSWQTCPKALIGRV